MPLVPGHDNRTMRAGDRTNPEVGIGKPLPFRVERRFQGAEELRRDRVETQNRQRREKLVDELFVTARLARFCCAIEEFARGDPSCDDVIGD